MAYLPDTYFPNDPDIQWLYLDLNSYFASVEQQLNPDLRGKPVAIVPVADTESTCAIAASYEAKAYGVKTGTMIYEAKRMCPELICVPANHEHYVTFHHRILAEIDRHIPIDAICSIDEVRCTLTGPQCDEAEAVALAKRIKAGIHRNIGAHVRSSIGIAPNWYLAKVASNVQKPDGLTVLRRGDLPGKLLGFAPSDLPGIGRGMSVRLRRNGIISMNDLWKRDARELRRIWGSIQGERFWHYLRGDYVPDIPTERRTIGHSHVLAPEWRPHAKAVEVGRRLLTKAASRLRRMDYYAAEMSVSVRVEDGERYRTHTKFPHVCDTVNLLHSFHPLWNVLMRDAGHRRVKKISITLHNLKPGDAMQPALFEWAPAQPSPRGKSGHSANEMALSKPSESRSRPDNRQPALTPPLSQREREYLAQRDFLRARRTKQYEHLSKAMDKLNARFGRDTVVFGTPPEAAKTFSGTKVAFTRIPDVQEFHE